MIELAFNIVLALVLIFFFVVGSQIPQQSNPADFIEAGGFPMIFATLGMILLIWESFVFFKTHKGKIAEKAGSGKYDLKNIYKVIVIVAMTISYIFIVDKLGFIIVTALFVFIAINLLGSKKQVFNVAFSVLCVAILVLTFGRFFGISLPRGVGVLRDISFYIY